MALAFTAIINTNTSNTHERIHSAAITTDALRSRRFICIYNPMRSIANHAFSRTVKYTLASAWILILKSL